MTSFAEFARKTRAQWILDAACDVLRANGPGASIEEIAKKAGVAKGTIYLHFPSKDALVQAVTHQGCDRIADFLFPSSEESTGLLPTVFDRLVVALEGNLPGIPPRWLLMSHFLDNHLPHQCPVFAGLVRALERGKSDAVVDSGVSNETAALLLLNMALVASVCPGADAATPDAAADVWRLFARAVGVSGAPNAEP